MQFGLADDINRSKLWLMGKIEKKTYIQWTFIVPYILSNKLNEVICQTVLRFFRVDFSLPTICVIFASTLHN